jgi:hypothetical protein
MPKIPKIPHVLRGEKGIDHKCLGEDPEIPQRRDLKGSCIGISEFYFKNYKKL